MKNRSLLVFGTFFLVLALTTCNLGTGSDGTVVIPGGGITTGGGGTSGGGGGDGGLISRSIKLYDGTDAFIGYVIPNAGALTVFSSNSYIYELAWDGDFYSFSTAFYFTGTNGAGTMFVLGKGYGKSVFYYINDGKLYTYKDLDANGIPLPNGTITQAESIWQVGTFINSTFPVSEAYELREITRTEAGIPASFTVPFRLSFE
jgi:hypothetical protein